MKNYFESKNLYKPLVLFLCLISFLLLLNYFSGLENTLAAIKNIVSANFLTNAEDDVSDAVLPAEAQKRIMIPAAEQIKNFNLISQLPTEEKPNIVIILTDDQHPGQVGVAGNNLIKTPNIDNLVRESGVYFKNMYLPIGQCAPSRAAIWTGKLPHANGVRTNGLILPPDQITLPEILDANGYDTAIIGKCHLGNPNNPEKYKRGFDFRLIFYPDSGMVNNWYSYSMSRNGKKESHKEYVTDFLTDEAVNYIEAHNRSSSSSPFFLWLAHVAPHTPTTPKKGSDVYSLEQMMLPESNSDNLSTKPPQQKNSLPHRDYVSKGKNGVLKDMEKAYEVVTNIDNNVGRITTAIKNAGIEDNTVVIFLSDNGVFFGEHEMLHKGPTFYNEQIKTPFIFHYPKMTFGATTTDALVSSIDIMPTILDMLGIMSPPDIQGKSFLPVLKGETEQVRSSVFMEYYSQQNSQVPMRGVVWNNWKWVHYKSGSKRDYELYDLANDPFEMNNILKKLSGDDNSLSRMLQDAVYGPILQKLRKERAVWQTYSLDTKYMVSLSGISVSSSSPGILNVSWTTDKDASSEIEYREENCSDCVTSEINDLNFTRNHSKNIINLKPDTFYTIKIYSIDSYGDGGYGEIKGVKISEIAP